MSQEYRIFKLFVDHPLTNPEGTLDDYLRHVGIGKTPRATQYYDVSPEIISSYFHASLEESVGFYGSHMMMIAKKDGLVEELDYENMRISKFETASGHKGILLSVPNKYP